MFQVHSRKSTYNYGNYLQPVIYIGSEYCILSSIPSPSRFNPVFAGTHLTYLMILFIFFSGIVTKSLVRCFSFFAFENSQIQILTNDYLEKKKTL